MSVERLTQLMSAATTLPPAIAAWLRAGYSRYLSGAPLEAALDLAAKPGQRRPATTLRTERRNSALREAWRLTAGDSPWRKSINLAAAIGRLPPIYRLFLAGRIPESTRNAALCRARQYGPLPEKARRIHSICAQPATSIHCTPPVDNGTGQITTGRIE